MQVLRNVALLFAILLFSGAGVLALRPGRPATVVRHYEFSGRAFGTTYRARWNQDVSGELSRQMQASIEQTFAEMDREISVYRSDSLLARFNAQRSTEPLWLPGYVVAQISFADELKRETHGAFDPSVLPLLKVWGFGPYPRRRTLPTPTEIFDARKRLGGVKEVYPLKSGPIEHVRKEHPDIELDLSAVGEGLALLAMRGLFEGHRIRHFYLEFGGEIFARGMNVNGRPWRVGIERPEPDAKSVWCVVELDGVGVSTSGSYRNVVEIDGKQYSHILDPRTGRPVEHAGVSVSVIHDDPVQADGWATALMVVGPEEGYELAKRKNLAALFIYREGGELKSRETSEFERYRVKDRAPANATHE